MTAKDFIRTWQTHALTERASAQEHFIGLCRLFDHPTPAEDDPQGERFTFEKGVTKTGGGGGYADVWKKGFFAWEYKKKKRDLNQALEQLTHYAAALENPPLHVVCDTVRFRIETRWTNSVVEKHEFELADLAEPHNFELLRNVFHDPEALRPKKTRAILTREAADKFQSISDLLQHRNPDREAVAHFVNQLVFCFFADSVKLLPEGLLKKLLQTCEKRPHRSKFLFDRLFAEMETGGEFDLTDIMHFNGGLFDGRRALVLEHGEIQLMFAASSVNWALIDPTIFGTLFERFLDPDKRAQIGAHYTDPAKIMMIVEPVVLRPLRAEWAKVKADIETLMQPVLGEAAAVGVAGKRERGKRFVAAQVKAEALRDGFIDRLKALRILDPACGSGNFLYLALQGVKDLEYRAILECDTLELRTRLPDVGPEILHGIEINPFAAELARSTIWIGDIQWRIANAIRHHPEPILRKLNAIECRDALLSPGADGPVEAEWPEADYIVGNPPFLGGKLLRRGLGDETVEALFRVYAGRVPAEADLVCYWFVKAWEAMQANRVSSVGLVATNSIRGGANRRVLEPMAAASAIFEAWSDEPWTVDGAAVRVSIVCFTVSPEADGIRHDGRGAAHVNSDLSATSSDLTTARAQSENQGFGSNGISKKGKFEIDGTIARSWIANEFNPNGKSNSDVLFPWRNGLHVMRDSFADKWIINFNGLTESEACQFEAPFEYLLSKVKPFREVSNSALEKKHWWRLARPASGLFDKLADSKRYFVTPEVSKHRVFVWLPKGVCPDKNLVAIARDDDTTFGILHSRFHEAWSLRLGTSLEDRPRYTPTTTFETFPFPQGLSPDIPAADYAQDPRAQKIAAAAKTLDDLRRAWLNPPDLVEIVPEVVPGYPDRILPKNVEAAAKLKERTLTNLYNKRPQWLADAHAALDRAVAAAYGWPQDIAIDDALGRLLALNLERAAKA